MAVATADAVLPIIVAAAAAAEADTAAVVEAVAAVVTAEEAAAVVAVIVVAAAVDRNDVYVDGDIWAMHTFLCSVRRSKRFYFSMSWYISGGLKKYIDIYL